MTDIQERLEHYEAQDRERQELEAKIKDSHLNMFIISKDKSEPDDEFRAVYLQHCELLRQYRRKYGLEAEEQLRDQLDEARRTYVEQYVAEKSRENLEKQLHLYRGALRYYRNKLNEARDKAAILSYALDMFTDQHPEHAEEIKALISISEDTLEDNE